MTIIRKRHIGETGSASGGRSRSNLENCVWEFLMRKQVAQGAETKRLTIDEGAPATPDPPAILHPTFRDD